LVSRCLLVLIDNTINRPIKCTKDFKSTLVLSRGAVGSIPLFEIQSNQSTLKTVTPGVKEVCFCGIEMTYSWKVFVFVNVICNLFDPG
jgi:hypothetical protein